MPHLKLDQSLVNEARALALRIGEPVIDFISEHTTVAIERATFNSICRRPIKKGASMMLVQPSTERHLVVLYDHDHRQSLNRREIHAFVKHPGLG